MVSTWACWKLIPLRGPFRQGGFAPGGLFDPLQTAMVSCEPPTMSNPLWRVML